MNSIVIKKRLDSVVIKLGSEAEPLLGKEVEITIKELKPPEIKQKKWKHLGAANLGGKTDHIHIRNFAHDE
ncbi:MAG: hypothetical protein ABI148_05020 [Ginsengibacter sp.]